MELRWSYDGCYDGIITASTIYSSRDVKNVFWNFFLPVIEDKKDIGKRTSPSFLLSPHQIIDSGAVVRLCFFYAERKTPNINRLVLIVLP